MQQQGGSARFAAAAGTAVAGDACSYGALEQQHDAVACKAAMQAMCNVRACVHAPCAVHICMRASRAWLAVDGPGSIYLLF